MSARSRIGLVALLCSAAARADHHATAMEAPVGTASSFAASMSLIAAAFSTTDYVGDYEGVVPAMSWTKDRFSFGAGMALYRLQENGRDLYGLGDAVVHGQMTLLARSSVQAGGMLAVSAPTGDSVSGLGMGHVMVMPAGWVTWHDERVIATASVGFGRALGDLSGHHDHGPWPLVEPMNMSELTWSASGDVAIAAGVHAGARVTGGVPMLADGHNRVVGAARVAWGVGQFDTAAELQAGIAGDPFTIRGVVETAIHF